MPEQLRTWFHRQDPSDRFYLLIQGGLPEADAKAFLTGLRIWFHTGAPQRELEQREGES